MNETDKQLCADIRQLLEDIKLKVTDLPTKEDIKRIMSKLESNR